MSDQIYAKVIADSISEYGDRLTTMELQFPRFILAEFNTHRIFSRNSASSRAIPTSKEIDWIMEDPVLPIAYGYNKAGMQSSLEMDDVSAQCAEHIIRGILDDVVEGVKKLTQLGAIDPKTMNPMGLHKQWTNRYLEPFMLHRVICSSTEWNNFFRQRISGLAQPEINDLAIKMRDALESSTPSLVVEGEWHMPYVREGDIGPYDDETLRRISVARCARVSYLTHEGEINVEKDLSLFERLAEAEPPHLSPMEHVASPIEGDCTSNFHGWRQMRYDYQ